MSTGSSLSLFDVNSQPEPSLTDQSTIVPQPTTTCHTYAPNSDWNNCENKNEDYTKYPTPTSHLASAETAASLAQTTDAVWYPPKYPSPCHYSPPYKPDVSDEIADFTSFYSAVELDPPSPSNQKESIENDEKTDGHSADADIRMPDQSVDAPNSTVKPAHVPSKSQRSVKLDQESVSYYEPVTKPESLFKKPKPMMTDAITSPMKYVLWPTHSTKTQSGDEVTLLPCDEVDSMTTPERLDDIQSHQIVADKENKGWCVKNIAGSLHIAKGNEKSPLVPNSTTTAFATREVKLTGECRVKVSPLPEKQWFDWSDECMSSFKHPPSPHQSAEEVTTNLAKPACNITPAGKLF